MSALPRLGNVRGFRRGILTRRDCAADAAATPAAGGWVRRRRRLYVPPPPMPLMMPLRCLLAAAVQSVCGTGARAQTHCIDTASDGIHVDVEI